MLSSELQNQLFSLLVPPDILASFDIISVDEKEEEIIIILLEKASKIPAELVGKDYVQNGYLNDLELQSAPIQCKTCYLKLRRRRWKEQKSADSKGCFNSYDFNYTGTKATKQFGAFLKENSG